MRKKDIQKMCGIMSMSENKTSCRYMICVNKDGITVEAPSKVDCIEMYELVSGVKKVNPINEAIR
jgi:hypothetical protein